MRVPNVLIVVVLFCWSCYLAKSAEQPQPPAHPVSPPAQTSAHNYWTVHLQLTDAYVVAMLRAQYSNPNVSVPQRAFDMATEVLHLHGSVAPAKPDPVLPPPAPQLWQRKRTEYPGTRMVP